MCCSVCAVQVGEHELIEALDVAVLGAEVSSKCTHKHSNNLFIIIYPTFIKHK